MREIILTEKFLNADQYQGSITTFFDDFLISSISIRKSFKSYIYKDDIDDQVLIRVPGCTQGAIIVDENMIIKDIIFNSKIAFNTEIRERSKIFIGAKLIFNKK